MLLAETFALVAISPDSGRPKGAGRDELNVCLAGLLLDELVLEGAAECGSNHSCHLTGARVPMSPTLEATADVVMEHGPKISRIVSHVNRGLKRRLDLFTWDAVLAGLVEAGFVAPRKGRLRPSYAVLDPGARDDIVTTLRRNAARDQPFDGRSALLLSMIGPAGLVVVVAPERETRRLARQRIEHALDGTGLEPIGYGVRRVIRRRDALSRGSGPVQ